MGEGSTVKLGENAKVTIERVENRGIFRAALNVLGGAFRFTTDALRKSNPRDVTIKVEISNVSRLRIGEVQSGWRP